jgi:hypothetical protein
LVYLLGFHGKRSAWYKRSGDEDEVDPPGTGLTWVSRASDARHRHRDTLYTTVIVFDVT